MGLGAVIGASCQTLEQARQAASEGADYIGFGSVFETQTKPERSAMDLDLLAAVYREIDIPVFAIGGITLERLEGLAKAGANRFAVCRDICLAENVAEKIRQYKSAIDSKLCAPERV